MHNTFHWSSIFMGRSAIPLWIKIAYTLFVMVLLPVYYVRHGPANFLWFSDIALFGTLLALWLESPLLASMMAVGVLVPEVGWIVDFFGRLLFGLGITGIAKYMFDPGEPLFLRGLSLFHILLPITLVWMLHRLGYDARALPAQTLLAWIVLLFIYFFTDPSKNIDWVFGLGSGPQTRIPRSLYFLLVMIIFPALIFLPTHWLLKKLFRAPHKHVTVTTKISSKNSTR